MYKMIKIEKSNCRPCMSASQYLDSKGIKYQAINISTEPEAIDKYGLTSVPVFILVDEQGNEIKRMNGYKTPSDLDELITELQGKGNEINED